LAAFEIISCLTHADVDSSLHSLPTCLFFQENQVTIECDIDEKFHRTVIGQKGKNVQAVTSKYNVQIKFPDRGNNANGALYDCYSTASIFAAIENSRNFP